VIIITKNCGNFSGHVKISTEWFLLENDIKLSDIKKKNIDNCPVI